MSPFIVFHFRCLFYFNFFIVFFSVLVNYNSNSFAVCKKSYTFYSFSSFLLLYMSPITCLKVFSVYF